MGRVDAFNGQSFDMLRAGTQTVDADAGSRDGDKACSWFEPRRCGYIGEEKIRGTVGGGCSSRVHVRTEERGLNI